MKRVVLRGELAKRFGRVHHFDLNTPAEAIRALCANFEGFQESLATAGQRGVGYIVQVGRFGLQQVEEIHNPTGQQEEISITPVLAGAGGRGGGIGQILAGIALVAIAIAAPGVGLFAGGSLGFGVVAGASGFAAAAAAVGGTIGLGLILSGTSQLLSPQPADLPGLTGGGSPARRDSFDPSNNDPADNRASYIYNGAVNLTAQGNPVPICYGRMRVGSVVVSAGVSTTDI